MPGHASTLVGLANLTEAAERSGAAGATLGIGEAGAPEALECDEAVAVKAAWDGPGRLVLEAGEQRWEAQLTVDGGELVADPDALLCAGLLPAMALGEALELDLPVSAELLRNGAALVEVLAGWWPDELTRVPIVAPVARRRRRWRPRETVLAYSGGVRSISALTGAPADRLVLVVEGMGEVAPPPATWPVPTVTVHTDLAAVLAATGVPAAAAAPTVVLAVVAHAVDGLGALVVTNSFGWLDQFAHGSHVLTDPLWSGAATAVDVVGAGQDRLADLEHVVRVAGDVRPVGATSTLTTAALRALGLADQWPEVDPVELEAVRSLPVVGPADLARVAAILRRLADGRDPELREALVEAVRATTPSGVAWPAGWTRVLPDLGRGRAA